MAFFAQLSLSTFEIVERGVGLRGLVLGLGCAPGSGDSMEAHRREWTKSRASLAIAKLGTGVSENTDLNEVAVAVGDYNTLARYAG